MMIELSDLQPASDDAVLRSHIRDGNREALGELVRRYASLVYAAARRQVRDADLAEDVMQNVFVTFAQRAREIRSAGALGSWLLRTTRFKSANAMKTESRRRTHEQSARLSRPEAATANEESQWLEIQPLLDDAMCGLPEKD